MREVIIRSDDLDLLSSEVLDKGGFLRFTARGSSMTPLIVEGDALVVGPVDPSTLKRGEIALYRSTSGGLAAHRIVGCRSSGTSDPGCIIVRGDAAWCGDEQIDPRDVLGLVTAVQKGGKTFYQDRRYRRLVGWLLARSRLLGLFLVSPGKASGTIVARAFVQFQGLKTYRRVAARFIGPQVLYREASVEDAQALAPFFGYPRHSLISERVRAAKLDLEYLGRLGFRLIAARRGTIAGSVVVQRVPSDPAQYPDWWLFGLVVRVFFRGARIGEGLVAMALERAYREGAACVHVLLRDDNRPAVALYNKLGFQPGSIPALEAQLRRNQSKSSEKWIILSKPLR